MKQPIHVCILTTGHATDDMRVYYKVAHSFAAAGMRLSWVGPDSTLYGQTPREPEIPLARHLFIPGTGRWGRLLRFRKACRTARAVRGVDVYYCPDPDSAYVALRLARRTRAKVILDLHENYQLPRTVGGPGTGLGRTITGRPIQLGIAFISRRCDLVMGVSDYVLAPYRRSIREGLVVRNCAPKWLFEKGATRRPRNEGPFTLMHGTGALARGTVVMLQALALAKSHTRELRAIVFNAFTERADGFGEEAFRQRVDALGIAKQVDLREPVSLRAIPGVLQSCHAGLIGYGRSIGEGSLPNRLFEYMAAGLAVIAPSYSVEIKATIEAEGCGLLVDFEDPAQVAQAMVELSEDAEKCRAMGARGREAFERSYNWETEIQPLLDRIEQWSSTRSLRSHG
jgi:glycosyltransferase involved in cell wall biosynthesis